MTDSNLNLEPKVFQELSKEQKKTLRKEYSNIKTAKILTVLAVIMAALLIATAICSLLVENWIASGTASSGGFFAVLIVLYEGKFVKWLETEKNIIIKRKK